MKGNSFSHLLFASLDYEAFPNGVYSKREEFVLIGADSFIKELIPIVMIHKREIGVMSSLGRVHIHSYIVS